MRLLIAGGHLTPALAFIEAASEHTDTLLYVGVGGTVEEQSLAEFGVKHTTLPIVKYDRYHKLTSLIRAPRMIKSLMQSRTIIKAFQPDAIVSFGSYISVPLVVMGKCMGVSVVIHEQTITQGLATKLAIPFAESIAVSYQKSQLLFPHHKTTHTGNLIRKAFYTTPTAPSWADSLTGKPMLYIAGGNQGSAFMNALIEELSGRLMESYQLIHQTGIKNTITPPSKKAGWFQKPWFSDSEVCWLFSKAKIYVGRSGANTVAELMAMGTPALFIPLPKSQQHEQDMNAALMADVGAARILPQNTATPQKFLESLAHIETEYQQYYHNAQSFKNIHTKDSAKKLYQLVAKAVHGR